MSKAVVERLVGHFGDRVLETSELRHNFRVRVAPGAWVNRARFLRDTDALGMHHFVELTAVDYPEREDHRFEIMLIVRSLANNHRIIVKTRLKDGEPLDTLVDVWAGA